MNRLDHNSKNIDNLRLWSFFTPSNSLFVCVVHVLWPFWISSKIVVILSVPTFTWKISFSKIIPTKLIVQTERVHPRESRKKIIWMLLWNCILCKFDHCFGSYFGSYFGKVFVDVFQNWFFLVFIYFRNFFLGILSL